MAENKKYWKGIEELEQTPEFVDSSEKEFADYVPVDEFVGKQEADTSTTNRRDFLKVLGFSVTAATLAACEAPVTKSIPFLNKPEDLTPGVPNYYSSTFFGQSKHRRQYVSSQMLGQMAFFHHQAKYKIFSFWLEHPV